MLKSQFVGRRTFKQTCLIWFNLLRILLSLYPALLKKNLRRERRLCTCAPFQANPRPVSTWKVRRSFWFLSCFPLSLAFVPERIDSRTWLFVVLNRWSGGEPSEEWLRLVAFWAMLSHNYYLTIFNRPKYLTKSPRCAVDVKMKSKQLKFQRYA